MKGHPFSVPTGLGVVGCPHVGELRWWSGGYDGTFVPMSRDDDPFPFAMSDIWLRRELVANGWTDRDIARAMRGELIHRIRRGAYVNKKLWRLLDSDRQHHRARARAALRTAHPASVLSHQSALAEWGVPLWRLPLAEVSITRTDGVSGRRERGIVHHAGAINLEHLTVRDGVPVSTPARAAVEALSVTDTELGYCLLNGVLHSRLTTIDEVRRVAVQAGRWPNMLGMNVALRMADARLASIAESRAMYFCYREGLPRPVPQVEVYDEFGNLVGIVDFLWQLAEMFLEMDGRLKYYIHRRPGETLEQYLIREKRRQERIVQLTGWLPVRIGWDDLERPQVLARRLHNLLEKRSSRVA